MDDIKIFKGEETLTQTISICNQVIGMECWIENVPYCK